MLVAAAVSTAVALAGVLLVRAEQGAGAPEGLEAVGVQVGTGSSSQVGPLEDPPDPSSLPALGLQFHGAWTHYDATERDEVLDRIERSGARWVRLDVGWAMLQPRPGALDEDWAVPLLDEVMDQLRERDLKVLVMFWLTPTWASSEPDEFTAQYTSPDDPADYAAALGRVAQRWGDVVDAYEVWNEPNLEVFYHGTDPETYADLLCATYPVVRREDPDARVVFGGLMYNDDEWLQRACGSGQVLGRAHRPSRSAGPWPIQRTWRSARPRTCRGSTTLGAAASSTSTCGVAPSAYSAHQVLAQAWVATRLRAASARASQVAGSGPPRGSTA